MEKLVFDNRSGASYEIPVFNEPEIKAEESQNFLVSFANNATSITASKLSRAKENLRSFFQFEPKETADLTESVSDPSQLNNITLRQKLNNAWLYLKYGNWRLKSNIKFDKDAPLWLLGILYSKPEDDSNSIGLQNFLLDHYSRIWLTYRTKLPFLPGTSETTDCGWGCMLRSCQMMIAQSLVFLHLGREWRFSAHEECTRRSGGISYPQIISLFGDDAGAQLGLHRVMEIANKKYENPVGCWYSPSEALMLFREALEVSDPILTGGLKMICVNDGFLVRNEISAVSNDFKNPFILVLCVRFGTTSLNKHYYGHILNFLSLKNTVGMIGGRPKHSVYFIGWYDTKYLIYLEPHVVHTAVANASEPAYLQSYHCTDVLRMELKDIDPSCAFGFLIQSETDFENTLLDLKKSQVIDEDCAEGNGSRFSSAVFTLVTDRPSNSVRHSRDFSETSVDQDFEIL